MTRALTVVGGIVGVGLAALTGASSAHAAGDLGDPTPTHMSDGVVVKHPGYDAATPAPGPRPPAGRIPLELGEIPAR